MRGGPYAALHECRLPRIRQGRTERGSSPCARLDCPAGPARAAAVDVVAPKVGAGCEGPRGRIELGRKNLLLELLHIHRHARSSVDSRSGQSRQRRDELRDRRCDKLGLILFGRRGLGEASGVRLRAIGADPWPRRCGGPRCRRRCGAGCTRSEPSDIRDDGRQCLGRSLLGRFADVLIDRLADDACRELVEMGVELLGQREKLRP